MMDKLEVCRLTAEALGKKHALGVANNVVWLIGEDDLLDGTEWDPLTNADQRWECVEWLLAHGMDCCLIADGTHISGPDPEAKDVFIETCQASEFPARAVAEISRTFRARG
jgi:hypothetical protein